MGTKYVVMFIDSLSSLMNLEERSNTYIDPDVYRIFKTISDLQEQGREVTLFLISAFVVNFWKMSIAMPWHKLLQPRIQPSA